MVEALFGTITDAIEGLSSALSTAFTNIVSVFWTAGENGSAGSPTFIGILLLVAVGAGLVFLVLRIIRGSVRGMAR